MTYGLLPSHEGTKMIAQCVSYRLYLCSNTIESLDRFEEDLH